MEGRESPVGWETVVLGAIATVSSGSGFPKEHQGRSSGDIGFYKVSDISRALSEGSLYLKEAKHYISDELVAQLRATIIPVGATVFAKIGEAIKLNRRALVGQRCVVDNNVMAVKADSEILDAYVYYYMRTKDFGDLSRATTVPSLRKSDLVCIRIPVAPYAEQRRIAAKLDATLAVVDACRQRLDGVAAILKRFRQAVLAAATSGELTREWREERGLELGAPRRLGEIIKVSSGKFLPAKEMAANGSIPVYGGNGVNGYHDDANVREPTLVIGRVGYHCGSVYLTPEKAWITDNALIVKHNSAETLREYLYFALQGVDLRANDSSTAQPVISGAKIYPVVLVHPPLEEQYEIVDQVENLFTLANQLEAKLTTARRLIERLTPALLAKAFRGELVPQDPNDELASVLLERIRAARQAEAAAGKPSRRGRRKAAAHPGQAPPPAAPAPPDLLTQLLMECGALSERALLAASELDPAGFRAQLALEQGMGAIRETAEDGQVLLEVVG